jgi:YidC/Oxa1 family membrane protein insertase
MGQILKPLEIAVAWLMVMWHKLLTLVGMPSESGWTWALSIVGLVVVIRIILIPLFVKQIKASRGLQLIQPEMKKIQAKYKGKTDPESRQAMTQETMALYKETGTNPFASCLPLIIQMPIFLCLFRLVNSAAHGEQRGVLTHTDALHFSEAKIFGARLADTFNGTHDTSVRILAAVLVIAMCATTFVTQRQLMAKNMPADAMSGQYAQQQKMLLYVLPFVFAISGIAFPIAAMLYWTTSNLWTMAQQFYVIRNNPAPGTPAEQAKLERDREKAQRKAARHGGAVQPAETAVEAAPEQPERPAARVQPKKQTRSQRKGKR